jgi:hypothetical protein
LEQVDEEILREAFSNKQGSTSKEASDHLHARRRGRDRPSLNRFNELIEQGPRLGFSDDVLLHTFFFSLTLGCMEHVKMHAGGDLMEKTLTEAAQLLQKISKAAACEEIEKHDFRQGRNTIQG